MRKTFFVVVILAIVVMILIPRPRQYEENKMFFSQLSLFNSTTVAGTIQLDWYGIYASINDTSVLQGIFIMPQSCTSVDVKWNQQDFNADTSLELCNIWGTLYYRIPIYTEPS